MSKSNSTNEMKVFFTVSNQTNLDEKLIYSLEKKNGFSDLKTWSTTNYRYNNRENYTIKIYSFDFRPSELLVKEPKNKNYKIRIILSYKQFLKDQHFYGVIIFKRDKIILFMI